MAYTHVLTVITGFQSALRGLDVDPERRLYAAGDAEVRVFDRRGAPVRRWETMGPAHAVGVAPDGRVFVGETGQIEIFDATGRLIETWRDARRLGRVTAIGFSGGEVIVADAAARTIRRLDANGTFVNDVGANNRMKGFQIPNGVLDFAIDDSGIIHASNPGKHRVERHEAADRLLDWFGRFDGIDPAGFSGCCNPTNVTLHRGRVFVTEKADPRVKVYDAGGRLLAVVASVEFDRNCKNMDIAVDADGRVYVADTVRRTVLAFEGDEEP